jgi:integrase
MDSKLIEEIKDIVNEKKFNRKQIYEILLSKNIVKPNSEKFVYELISYCLDEGIIPKSKIKRYKKKSGKLPEVFPLESLVKIFDNVTCPKLAMCLWVGFFCGLRIGEVCRILTTDVDVINKKIFIRDGKNTNRSKQGYGRDRVVTLPTISIPVINRWLKIIDSSKYFIPNYQNRNNKLNTKSVHIRYRNLMEKCGLNEVQHTTEYTQKINGKIRKLKKNTYKYRFHTNRHTYATYLLEKGVPITTISKLLGHNQLDTTMVYAKISDKSMTQELNEAFDLPMKLVNGNKNIMSTNSISNTIDPLTSLKNRLVNGEIDLTTFKIISKEIS